MTRHVEIPKPTSARSCCDCHYATFYLDSDGDTMVHCRISDCTATIGTAQTQNCLSHRQGTPSTRKPSL